jgi:hypothetical protein
MKMNARMSGLLSQMNIPAVPDNWVSPRHSHATELTTADGCVLLKDGYDTSRSVKLSDFPDKTGYEAFVNHIHFPFDGTQESLLRCLSFTRAIRRALTSIAGGRRFEIVVSVSDEGTVRFYEIRPGEIWIVDDLESYTEEAILLLYAGSG